MQDDGTTGGQAPSAKAPPRLPVVAAIALVALGLTGWFLLRADGASDSGDDARPAKGVVKATEPPTTTGTATDPDLSQVPPDGDGTLSPPAGFARPWGKAVPGLLTFRGNPTRSYHGRGPVPSTPGVRWDYPDSGPMCSESTVGDETKTWCGTGWTGQPAVFERDGRQWVVFGAYDASVHFIDGTDGTDILAPFQTGDIIKGSVTVDPDGFHWSTPGAATTTSGSWQSTARATRGSCGGSLQTMCHRRCGTTTGTVRPWCLQII
ncbi:MAG: hypothetical protein M5U19_14665 [Microthrixaceae bacterium]|nr:hypothetical protein [Microthrixaceae bacterium]